MMEKIDKYHYTIGADPCDKNKTAKAEFKTGEFEWTDKQKSKVQFVERKDGRFRVQIWKPNLIQRFLYWIRLLKDPRYNGKKVD